MKHVDANRLNSCCTFVLKEAVQPENELIPVGDIDRTDIGFDNMIQLLGFAAIR